MYEFKRDYQKEPLKLIPRNKCGGLIKEKPYKEDLEYLLNIPMTLKEIGTYFGVNEKSVRRWKKYFNIETNWKKVREKSAETYFKENNRNIYDDNLEKTKQTKLEKYGNENYNNQEKIIATNMKRYNSPFYLGTDDCLDKTKKTNMERYGSEWVMQNDTIYQKSKQTKLEKYGNENYNNKEGQQQTCMERYGVKSFAQTDKFKEKQYITKKKNKSFNTSKPEEEIYNLLCQKFNDVKRQYKSELYPFTCDFYIPEIDTYIEYQGIWAHGNEPYIGTDKQNLIIQKWKDKNTTFYKNAIHIWTISDPLKRNTAKKNNLNWIEFFNMNQFMNWYSK